MKGGRAGRRAGGGGGAAEELEDRGWRAPGAVVEVFAVLLGTLPLVLAQEGPGAHMEDPDEAFVPLHRDLGPDATGRLRSDPYEVRRMRPAPAQLT